MDYEALKRREWLNIEDDFLPLDIFNKLQTIMSSNDFAWFYCDGINRTPPQRHTTHERHNYKTPPSSSIPPVYEEENKTNTVYGYDLSKITKENVLEISNDILKKDLQKTEQILIKTHGNKFINLDDRRKQMLIDMQFNVRNFDKPEIFKNFKKALFAGDEEGMKKEYTRVFTAKKGQVKSLARNKFFKKYFLDK